MSADTMAAMYAIFRLKRKDVICGAGTCAAHGGSQQDYV